MPWPLPQEYNEAIQNPHICFSVEELRKGEVERSAIGLPRADSGAFASVYRLNSEDSHWAIRCFLRNVYLQRDRYLAIARYLEHLSSPYIVPFEYIDKGINIDGYWYPLIRMNWVSGLPLDRYIGTIIESPEALAKLADDFLHMHFSLLAAGMAHCDLQHGNILVTAEGELKLVDYDGMYVPSMEGLRRSEELGHANYQHPDRTASDFSDQTDNFSAWVIYSALRCLAIDNRLWSELNGGDECLLLRASDLRSPTTESAFGRLEKHDSIEIRSWARMIRYLRALDSTESPPVSDEPADVELPDLEDPIELDLTALVSLTDNPGTPGGALALKKLPAPSKPIGHKSAVRQVATSKTAEFAYMTMLKNQASQGRFKFGHKGLQKRYFEISSQVNRRWNIGAFLTLLLISVYFVSWIIPSLVVYGITKLALVLMGLSWMLCIWLVAKLKKKQAD